MLITDQAIKLSVRTTIAEQKCRTLDTFFGILGLLTRISNADFFLKKTVFHDSEVPKSRYSVFQMEGLQHL